MTPTELKSIREKLGLKPGEMAAALKTPRRSYQDWESGRRRIPGICEVAVALLQEKDRWVMQKIAPGFTPTRLREAATPVEE